MTNYAYIQYIEEIYQENGNRKAKIILGEIFSPRVDEQNIKVQTNVINSSIICIWINNIKLMNL